MNFSLILLALVLVGVPVIVEIWNYRDTRGWMLLPRYPFTVRLFAYALPWLVFVSYQIPAQIEMGKKLQPVWEKFEKASVDYDEAQEAVSLELAASETSYEENLPEYKKLLSILRKRDEILKENHCVSIGGWYANSDGSTFKQMIVFRLP